MWLLLGVGGGLSSPGVVLRAFGAGTVASIAGSFVLERAGHLGARGCLHGFVAGQAVAIIGMLVGVLRALPAVEEPTCHPPLWTAIREYRLLGLSAFAFYLSVWADKLAIWLLAGRDRASIYLHGRLRARLVLRHPGVCVDLRRDGDRLHRLVVETFQSQPYATERPGDR